MTPEAQRIAIAEACGWTECRLGGYGAGGAVERSRRPVGTPPKRKYTCELPYYLHDLNAMHEAEKVLMDEQLEAWAQWLCALTMTDSQIYGKRVWCAVKMAARATASQRAEAFLRTLNLWVEPTTAPKGS